MHVAIVTFDGFSEIDTFVALGLLNRLEDNGWRAELASPAAYVTSTNGVTVQAQRPLEFANDADVVLFGSNMYARALSSNSALLDRLTLDPLRQTIGAIGSGSLLLARLGLDLPATEYHTVGGMVVSHLRHLATPGESFEAWGFRFTVVDATERSIKQVRAERAEG